MRAIEWGVTAAWHDGDRQPDGVACAAVGCSRSSPISMRALGDPDRRRSCWCRWSSASPMPSATSSFSIRSAAASSGSPISATLVHDENFWNALRNTAHVDRRLGAAAIRPRPDPGAAAQPAVSRPSDGPGAGLPALGGADLPVGPELGLAVQSGRRPDPALDGRPRPHGRRRRTSSPIPRRRSGDRSSPMSGGAFPSSPSRCSRRCSRSRATSTRRRRSTAPAPFQRFRSITLPFLAPTIAITCCCAPSGSPTPPT